MSAHTPGPWLLTVERSSCEGVNATFRIDTPYQISVAGGQSQEHLGEPHILEAECIANGRLIMTAPDMLAALYEALEFAEDQSDVVDGPDGVPQANAAMRLVQTLQAAIDKAEGKA